MFLSLFSDPEDRGTIFSFETSVDFQRTVLYSRTYQSSFPCFISWNCGTTLFSCCFCSHQHGVCSACNHILYTVYQNVWRNCTKWRRQGFIFGISRKALHTVIVDISSSRLAWSHISSGYEGKTVSLISHFLLTRSTSCTFSPFQKKHLCLKLLIPTSNAVGRWGITLKLWLEGPLNRNNCFMFRKLQHTKHSLFRSRHFLFVTSLAEWEEGRGESGDCACDLNLNPCSFVPCGKHTSACISKAGMVAWNRSNDFGTRCIHYLLILLAVNLTMLSVSHFV